MSQRKPRINFDESTEGEVAVIESERIAANLSEMAETESVTLEHLLKDLPRARREVIEKLYPELKHLLVDVG